MIRQKSAELLQAQAITFGRETGLLQRDGSAWPPQTAYTAHGQEFARWLRSTEASHSWLIEGRELLISNFKHFDPYLKAYRIPPDPDMHPRDHPYFLNQGSSAAAYKISVGNQQYVARTLGGDTYVPNTIDIYALPMLIALGEKGMEQIVACSYEKNICISSFVPGISLENMQPADLALVSVDHIYQALGTIERIEELGLYIDPIPVHWIFHPDNGFTLIDFDHPFDCPTKAGNDPLHFLRYLLQEIELDNAPMPGLLDALMGLEQRTKTACHMRYPAGSSVLNRVMTVLDGITAKRALCAQGIFSPDIVDDYLDAYMTTLRG